jgi:hypothetical protein
MYQFTDVSEEYTAFIFRVEDMRSNEGATNKEKAHWIKNALFWNVITDDEGSIFLSKRQ